MNLDFGQQKKAKERFFLGGGGDFGSKLKIKHLLITHFKKLAFIENDPQSDN